MPGARKGLRAHREEVRKWASTAPHIEMLEIDCIQASVPHDPAAFPNWWCFSARNGCLERSSMAALSTGRCIAKSVSAPALYPQAEHGKKSQTRNVCRRFRTEDC